MAVDQDSYNKGGFFCCGPWLHRSHPSKKKKMGLLLIMIGLVWLGARIGLLDLTWLHAIPFWPAVLILVGAWLVYNGLMRERPRAEKEEV